MRTVEIRKFSKKLGNTVGKGEIAPFPALFSKDLYCRHIITRVCLFGKGLNDIEWDFIDKDKRKNSGGCGARSDCIFVQVGLSLHYLFNKIHDRTRKEGLTPSPNDNF